MWFDIKLACRNIFRSKRCTFIAGIAIGVGLAAIIFTDALMIGMKDNMLATRRYNERPASLRSAKWRVCSGISGQFHRNTQNGLIDLRSRGKGRIRW